MGKTKLRLDEIDEGIFLFNNRYTILDVPKRGELLKGLKLKEGDMVEITMKKVKK